MGLSIGSLFAVAPGLMLAAVTDATIAIRAAVAGGVRGRGDRFLGGSLMTFWGVPGPMAIHAQRAVRARRAVATRFLEDPAT